MAYAWNLRGFHLRRPWVGTLFLDAFLSTLPVICVSEHLHGESFFKLQINYSLISWSKYGMLCRTSVLNCTTVAVGETFRKNIICQGNDSEKEKLLQCVVVYGFQWSVGGWFPCSPSLEHWRWDSDLSLRCKFGCQTGLEFALAF